MILFLAHLNYFFAFYILIHGVYAFKRDSWCGTLMCVAAVVNGSITTYEMTALSPLGWMSIGFGSHMSNTPMVILWKNSDGSVTLSQRQAHGLVEPRPVDYPLRRARTSQRKAMDQSSPLSLFFDIPTHGDAVQQHIWAFGSTRPTSDPSTVLEQHLGAGTFTLDFSKDTNEYDAINGTSHVGSPSATSSFLLAPTSSASPNSTPLIPPHERSDIVPMYEKLIIAHGALTSVGFLVFLPIGSLLARYGRVFTRHWFKSHWFFNLILGFPFITIGWAFGFLAVAEQGSLHLADAHHVFGIALFILYAIQILLGSTIHSFRRMHDLGVARPPQNFAHIILGLSIVVLAFYETRTGLTHDLVLATGSLKSLDSFLAIWTAWAIIIPIVYLLGFLFLPRQLEQERLGVNAPSPTQFSDSQCPPTYLDAIGIPPRRTSFTVADNTLGMYSDTVASPHTTRKSLSSAGGMAEMREVQSLVPVALARHTQAFQVI